MVGVDVIESELLTGADVPEREEQDVTVHDSQEDVRCTGMIHVLSAIPTAAPIDCPIGVDAANANPAPPS